MFAHICGAPQDLLMLRSTVFACILHAYSLAGVLSAPATIVVSKDLPVSSNVTYVNVALLLVYHLLGAVAW